MDIGKISAEIENHGPELVLSAIAELEQWQEKVRQEAIAAYDDYFNDVRQREYKAEQRITDLTKQESDIKAKIAAMQPGLVDATISGDAGAFDRRRDAMADLEARRAAIAYQLQLLSDAAVPGDRVLFEKAEAKYRAFGTAVSQYQENFSAIWEFACQQKEIWSKICDDSRPAYRTGGYLPPFRKLEEHFESQGRKTDAPAQKPKATEEEPPMKNCETAVYRFGQM